MPDITRYIIIVLAVVVVAVVAAIIISNLQKNRRINVRTLTLNDALAAKEIRSYAISYTAAEYKNAGKPITTQKGAYRANFSKDFEKRRVDIVHQCCQGNKFSEDFCNYAEEYYPDPRAKELYSIIGNYLIYRDKKLHEDFNSFLSQMESITPEEFFEIKKFQQGDVVGVYVIHNEDKDMYYVGQAKRLFFRVNQHFTGHGNGDVYADYKYGGDFSIKMIRLSESGYSDLDKLERDLINEYDACGSGYNRTAGNSN